MKLVSWNVNGIRAVSKKNLFDELNTIGADIYCFQETKAQDDQVKETIGHLEEFHLVSNSAVKKGYSGVAVLSKEKPIEVLFGIGIEEHDQEGRVVTIKFEKFTLINVYVPNSGDGLKRLDYRQEWDRSFADYIARLKEDKPVVVTGDLNVAHQAIDLARPKENYNKTSGYTQTEIDGLDYLLSKGFIDSYRSLHPDKVQYSFWSQRFFARAKNAGWRIDYFLVDQALKDGMVSATIEDQIMGSDHCPITLTLNL